MCEEFSRCYNYNYFKICFWTNGSRLTQSAAQSACQERNSTLPRITNSTFRSVLRSFFYQAGTGSPLYDSAVWIDLKAVDADDFHWIDGSSFVGECLN